MRILATPIVMQMRACVEELFEWLIALEDNQGALEDTDTMSISAGRNLAALRLSGQMRLTSSRLAGSFERLSTGNRINRSADDPAGLAIADKLRLDSRLMTVALRNATDAVSIVTVTDDALAEISNILGRMSELSLQSANSTYSTAQRSSMQLEFSALGSEVERISSGVSFNDRFLLSGSSDLQVQVGIVDNASARIIISSVVATLDSLGLGSGASLTYSLTGTTTEYAVSASGAAYSAIQSALDNITVQRGVVGSVTARLSTAIATLSTTRETISRAESFIREADTADETAEFVRLQVLQSLQTSLFTQANQLAGRVTSLLSRE